MLTRIGRRTTRHSSFFSHPRRLTTAATNTRNGLSSLFRKPQNETALAKFKFLHENCKSGNFTLSEALDFFDYMIRMKPVPHFSSFSILFSALVKNSHYDTVVSLHERLNSAGLMPDLTSLNILLNCFCNMSRISDGFVVFGSILRRGFFSGCCDF